MLLSGWIKPLGKIILVVHKRKILCELIFSESKCLYQFFKNILSYSILKIISLGLSVVYVMYLGRLLSAEMLGVYYLTITVVTLAMVLSRLGFDMLIVKKVSIYFNKKDITAILNLFKFVNRRVINLTIILILLIFVFSGKISLYLLDDETYKIVLLIVSGTLYFYNMLFIYSEAFKAIGELGLSVIFSGILFPLLNIIGISILFPYFDELGVFISVSATILIMYVLSVFIFNKKLSKYEVENVSTTDIEKYSIPYDFYFISLANYVFASIDTLILGFLSSNSDVGIYNILLRVVMPFSILLIVINNVFARDFSIWHSNGENDKYIDAYAKLVHISFVFGVVYFAVIVFTGDYILLFFGKDYLGGSISLLILSLGSLLLLITGPSATILMMTGHETEYKKLVVCIGILNVVLSVVLVYSYGLIGAAISTSVSLAVKNIASFLLARKYLGVKLF